MGSNPLVINHPLRVRESVAFWDVVILIKEIRSSSSIVKFVIIEKENEIDRLRGIGIEKER